MIGFGKTESLVGRKIVFSVYYSVISAQFKINKMKKINLIILLFLRSLTFFGQDSLYRKKDVLVINKSISSTIDESKTPFVIVDGTLVSYDLIEKFDPEKIKEVTVIKRDSSSIFVHNSRQGTILITTKNISKKELNKLYKLYAYSFEPNTNSKTKIISGKITDCEDVPIKASVENLNSKIITQSDSLGNYAIEVHEDDVLLFSKFGSISQRVLIEKQKKLNISLKENPKNETIRVLKPIIYLYPKEKTEITLSFDFKGKLLTTFPKYEENWKVIAEPNGQLFDTKTKRKYSSLFWDGDISFEPEHYQYESGFVIEKENLTEFLIEKLEYIGLNTTETNEFIQFWLPILEQNNYNFIHFLVNEKCNEVSINHVNPKPDTSIRVYMEFYGLDDFIHIKEQTLPKTKRKGFTLVEWGGSDVTNQVSKNKTL